MNVLRHEQRLAVLCSLVNGNSVRATQRMTGVNLRTILHFGVRLGVGAEHFHNAVARDLHCPLVEQDEVWSYVAKKQARCTPEQSAAGMGEAYTFVALDKISRFAIAWRVGKRDAVTALAFEADTRARLSTMPSITTDGFVGYPAAIGAAFGPGVNYAQSVKHYTRKGRRYDDHRYEPPRQPFLTKHIVFGSPDTGRATTAHLERQNGTMRHFIGRMRRLVYAFSKKAENHKAAIALAYTYYNYCWVIRALKGTPAMALGLARHAWELDEFMDALLSAPACAPPEGRALDPATPHAVTEPSGQLDLFSWKPRAPPAPRREAPRQLSLFDLDPEPSE